MSETVDPTSFVSAEFRGALEALIRKAAQDGFEEGVRAEQRRQGAVEVSQIRVDPAGLAGTPEYVAQPKGPVRAVDRINAATSDMAYAVGQSFGAQVQADDGRMVIAEDDDVFRERQMTGWQREASVQLASLRDDVATLQADVEALTREVRGGEKAEGSD